jgi:hypothetical protein
MRNNEADRKKVQALAESGEALKMIDSLIKAHPEKAAEIAETRFEMQKQRLSTLTKENPDRAKILFWEHRDELKAFGDNKVAKYDKMISLIEQDKIDHPSHTRTWNDYMEEEKKKRLEKLIDERYEQNQANVASVKPEKEGNGSLILGAFALGVAACAIGAPNLAVVSFAVAFMVAEYEEATKGLEGSKGTLKEMSKDDIRTSLIARAKEAGKDDIANALER